MPIGLDLATGWSPFGRRRPSRAWLAWAELALAPGTVISQSSKAGADVRAGASVALVIAKAPPPPLTTAPVPPTTAAPRNCDPAYPDVCLHQEIGDYDCAGGSGNGPNYVEGPIRVLPPDPFDLDGNDNDGIGCESG
jgi:hypothetical protein